MKIGDRDRGQRENSWLTALKMDLSMFQVCVWEIDEGLRKREEEANGEKPPRSGGGVVRHRRAAGH